MRRIVFSCQAHATDNTPARWWQVHEVPSLGEFEVWVDTIGGGAYRLQQGRFATIGGALAYVADYAAEQLGSGD